MQKVLSIAAAAGLGLATAGCSLLGSMFGGGGGGGFDMAKATADTPDTKGKVQLNGAAMGAWASWDDGAGNVSQWWGVTGEKDGNWVVEMRMPAAKMTYAWVVNSEGEKLEAYVANWDPENKDAEKLSAAYERKLQDPPEHPAGEKPEMQEGNESVNAAGKDWDCKWMSMQVMGKESKTWMCDQVPFSGMVKSMYDGKVTSMLKEVGDGATMGFKWPEKKE